jgi:hypothetical protein
MSDAAATDESAGPEGRVTQPTTHPLEEAGGSQEAAAPRHEAVPADEGDSSEKLAKADLATAAEPLLGQFTQSDRRLLVVTIAGTVLANLVTVLIVGLALILVRAATDHGHPLGWGDWIELAILPAAGIYAVVSLWRNSKTEHSSVRRLRYLRIVIGVIIFTSVVELLFWVGLASGLGH